ncbi:MAG TPA: hypothetical protein VEK07_25175 [Polyangiaceae bacterium]|nr:hypothetical protein [Polyangiaceae bacterium]
MNPLSHPSGASEAAPTRANKFFRTRVTILSTILLIVILWAWRDVRSRRERNDWERPLSVAIVLVRRGSLDAEAVDAFRERIPALDARLVEECHRYRPASVHPFVFTFFGPIDMPESLPKMAGSGLLASARESWALWRWTSRADRKAGLDARIYDSRVYVVARPPLNAQREVVEGESEEGGRVGTVEVELDASMADFALFVTAHELLHTLGASDKYDSTGKTLIPSGLAEPDRDPPFPQRFAEVMARNLPVDASTERPPTSLDELGVGPVTASEIGWLRGSR